MAYSREIYEEAMAELERRRMKANAEAASLKERMQTAEPRVRQIEQAMAGACLRVARAVLDGGDVEAAVEKIKNENLALQAEMASLLHAHGEQADNFEPRYTCAKCQDTGYTEGGMCNCFSDLLKEVACRRLSRTTSMKLTRFEEMDLHYYPDTPDPKTGVSPRARMGDVLAYCRCYAADFSLESPSLLFQGPTGTGKTHLSLAIARGVAEKGFTVVYGPAQQLLHRLEKEHFGRASGDSEDALEQSDLLVLDDLGTEFSSPFYTSCIYNIVNSRMLAGLPTIISTNLNQKQLLERYGEAVTSRITGTFQPLLFWGKDIRQLKLRQKLR